jgi:hypothetical protein
MRKIQMIVCPGLLSVLMASMALAQTTTLVSVNSTGTATGNGLSLDPVMSADGRFVAFGSDATDLVTTPDNNNREDIFVRDLQTNTTRLVSVNSAGNAAGNSGSGLPVISADGRFVAFLSSATDLVTTIDNNNDVDIFVRDLQTNTTRLVSVNRSGTATGNHASGSDNPVMSADGRFVAFLSSATDLVTTNDNDNSIDIFVRDLQTNTTELVSINSSGIATGNGGSGDAVISADGRFVAFVSIATDLVTTSDNNNNVDIFVRDLQTNTTELVSVNSAGNAAGNSDSGLPVISADGRFVAFGSHATDLVTTSDNNNDFDAFVRDLQTNTTKLVSVNGSGTATGNAGSGATVISADGRFVAFNSDATDLVTTSDSNNDLDAFVRDLQTNTTKLVSINSSGTATGNTGSGAEAISADGRFVAFATFATNLVTTPDNNNDIDIFVRDLQTNTTKLASVNSSGAATGNGFSVGPVLSADGRFVAFVSIATDLVTTSENNNNRDIFIFGPLRALTSTAQFNSGTFSVDEGAGSATITVTRSGDTSGASTVDVATSDGTALQRTDYIVANGTLSFAANQTSNTFTVLIVDDVYVEGNETLNLTLSNPTGGAALGSPSIAVLRITDNDSVSPTTNPLDNSDARFFVQQHYYDFLSRESDPGGLAFWTNEITSCPPGDQLCVNARRIRVSDAFFFEPEFQQTGSFVFRLYRAAYGNNQPFPNPDADPRFPGLNLTVPSYAVFKQDRAQVVGGTGLAQSQLALANAFVQRPEFLTKYSTGLSVPGFVDSVLATIRNGIGAELASQRDTLIGHFNTGGRGLVMFHLANDYWNGCGPGVPVPCVPPNVGPAVDNRSLIDKDYNLVFVTTEYFGYLRRDADTNGLHFWLFDQVNRFPLRNPDIQHAMVCSFITSIEYQQRFSPVVTHTNAECPQ